MPVRADLLLFLLAPALLIAALSCGDSNNGDIEGSGTSGNCGTEFGGPYPFGGPTPKAMQPKEIAEKLQAFALYKGLELSVSQVTKLESIDVFAESIRANRKAPNGELQQKYNYVIIDNGSKCEIFVATWSGDDPKIETYLKQIEDEIACLGGGADTGVIFRTPTPGLMINFAPEDPFENPFDRALVSATPQSPCWLLLDKDKPRKDGLLDAISKHFMLAQKDGETIDDYNKKSWSKAKVAYAGEILVDVVNCTYIVTEDSGTYRPWGEFRRDVNIFFATAIPANRSTVLGQPNFVPGC